MSYLYMCTRMTMCMSAAAAGGERSRRAPDAGWEGRLRPAHGAVHNPRTADACMFAGNHIGFTIFY